MLDKRRESFWMSKLPDQSPFTNISDVLSRLQDPIPDLGRELHVQFSGVNLRGIKTHEVEVRRRLGDNYDYEWMGIKLSRTSMALSVSLTPEEIAAAGPTLTLFINQLQITDDIRKGILVLHQYDRNVDSSDLSFDVGLLIDKKAEDEGKSGIRFSSWGNAQLIPEVKDRYDSDSRSPLEKANHKLLHDLHYASSPRNFHPLIARGIYETGLLLGRAVSNRRLDSIFFD